MSEKIEPADPGIPKGYRKIQAQVFVGPNGRLVIEAEPDEVWPDEKDADDEHPHNCDAMGCGWCHVVAVAQLPNHTRTRR